MYLQVARPGVLRNADQTNPNRPAVGFVGCSGQSIADGGDDDREGSNEKAHKGPAVCGGQPGDPGESAAFVAPMTFQGDSPKVTKMREYLIECTTKSVTLLSSTIY